MNAQGSSLSPEECEIYSWQMDVPGFGLEAQQKLKNSTVFISRVGGLGGLVAMELAAAGVGRMILASGGILLHSDLNRQLLQTHSHLGKPRMENIVRRLQDLNPRLEILAHPENVSEENVERLVSNADVIVDAAPLFKERFVMNRTAVHLGKPMVECAMYALEATLTTFLPGKTGCLACLIPEPPPTWKRRFPVLGAVSGAVGCLGATEVIKLLTGIGTPLLGILLQMDLGTMHFRRLRIHRDENCPVCAHRS